MNKQPIEIRPLSGSKIDEKAFIEFPKQLYRGCNYYVPMFDMDMRFLIRKKHPFFLHSEGQFLLVWRGQELGGR